MPRTVSLQEYFDECVDRFGPNRDNWKFVCPSCGHVASVADYKAADANAATGFSCIGRWTGATQQAFQEGPGPCNYAGGGLICINPVTVVSPEGRVHMFELAPAEPWVNIGDKVTWTKTSGRGRTISMRSRSGTVIEIRDFVALIRVDGQKKTVSVALHDLRLAGQKSQLTELVEAVVEANRGS